MKGKMAKNTTDDDGESFAQKPFSDLKRFFMNAINVDERKAKRRSKY